MINKRKDYESDETDEFNSNELILYDMEGLANVTDMYSWILDHFWCCCMIFDNYYSSS